MTDQDVRDYFRDLYELATDASASLDDRIAEAIAIGRDRLDLQYGVLSYTGDGVYEVVDSTATEGSYLAGSTHDLGDTWCRHVVADREPLVIADVDDSEYSDDIAVEATGLRCYIGAPIAVDGDVYGTLCYSSDRPRERSFDDDDRRFVELLTCWIAREIERDRHYETLEAQNARLDEFAGVLAHDLRNPLSAARGYTELAAESVDEPEAGYLRTALDSLDRIDAMVGDTLALAREGADVGEREPVELGTVVRVAWETVAPADATLTVADDRTLVADESRLRQLFENLFRNVAEHCGPDTTVTVRGTDDGFVVEDDGPGLPPWVAESLFGEDFDRDRRGLGLLVVERVVSGHGWHGAVDADESGTRLVVSGVSDAPQATTPA